MIGNTLKSENTVSVGRRRRRRRRRKNYKVENGIFENVISPEPNRIFRRSKRRRKVDIKVI